MAKSFNLEGLVATGEEPVVEPEPVNSSRQSNNKPKLQAAPKSKAPAQAGPPKRLSLSLDADTYRALRMHAVETDQTHQAILEAATIAYLRKHASA